MSRLKRTYKSTVLLRHRSNHIKNRRKSCRNQPPNDQTKQPLLVVGPFPNRLSDLGNITHKSRVFVLAPVFLSLNCVVDLFLILSDNGEEGG
jgi:hypothetical protein